MDDKTNHDPARAEGPECEPWCGQEMSCRNSPKCCIAGGTCWCSRECADARRPLRPTVPDVGGSGAREITHTGLIAAGWYCSAPETRHTMLCDDVTGIVAAAIERERATVEEAQAILEAMRESHDGVVAERDQLRAALAESERERDAYKRAKTENDDRYMGERDEARRDRDRLAAEVGRLRAALTDISDGNYDNAHGARGAMRIARAALAPPTPVRDGGGDTLNQCDGCRRGMPLRNGMHVSDIPWDGMMCTADRYRPPTPATSPGNETCGTCGGVPSAVCPALCSDCKGTGKRPAKEMP